MSATKSQAGDKQANYNPNEQFKKERFNEELNLNARPQNRKDEALSAYSKGPASTVGAARDHKHHNDKSETQSRAQSSYFKKRILDKIN